LEWHQEILEGPFCKLAYLIYGQPKEEIQKPMSQMIKWKQLQGVYSDSIIS
jgi:hypothetical protein